MSSRSKVIYELHKIIQYCTFSAHNALRPTERKRWIHVDNYRFLCHRAIVPRSFLMCHCCWWMSTKIVTDIHTSLLELIVKGDLPNVWTKSNHLKIITHTKLQARGQKGAPNSLEPKETPLRHYSSMQGMTVAQDTLTHLMIIRKKEAEKNEQLPAQADGTKRLSDERAERTKEKETGKAGWECAVALQRLCSCDLFPHTCPPSQNDHCACVV